jgi:hypothetical protein
VEAEELRLDPNADASRINLDVYRARRQLIDAGIPNGHQLIERRARTRQLRLGVMRIVVTSS